jgi:hypothetical protein
MYITSVLEMQIPFDFAQGRLSTPLKKRFAQDDRRVLGFLE